jgi:hypothetical protein
MELALLIYAIGFGWELWNVKRLFSLPYMLAAIGLASAWFVLDWVAIYLGIWSFPAGGTLPYRV